MATVVINVYGKMVKLDDYFCMDGGAKSNNMPKAKQHLQARTCEHRGRTIDIDTAFQMFMYDLYS